MSRDHGVSKVSDALPWLQGSRIGGVPSKSEAPGKAPSEAPIFSSLFFQQPRISCLILPDFTGGADGAPCFRNPPIWK